MGSTKGQAAKFAYDPKVLAEYVESHSTAAVRVLTVQRDGRPRRQKTHVKLVNGQRFDQTCHARQLLRWRNGSTTGVSRHGTERFLATYHLTPQDFERWALAQGYTPILWDRRTK